MAVKSRIATARSIFFLTVLSLVGVFLSWGCQKEQNPLTNPPPPNVTVEKVVLQTVPVHLSYVATTVSVKHYNLYRTVSLYGGNAPGYSTGDAIKTMEACPPKT